MDAPPISVIIPTCNRPAFLPQAVSSVLSQSCLPSELLIVDDGAGADHTVQPLAAGSPIPIRILAGPARGPGAARNVGLSESTGRFLAFLDDDDLWHPRKLEWQLAALHQHPWLGLLGTFAIRFHGNQAPAPTSLTRPPRPRLIGRAALLRANRIVMSSALVKRECFAQCGGFDESLPLAQDWDMWLRIRARCAVGVLAAPLTVHRLHADQRSADAAEMRRWELQVVRRAISRGLTGWWARGVAGRRLAWGRYRLERALGQPVAHQRANQGEGRA
jgi:glycosyltransferase involved in cell wall biosynthesis